MIIAIHIAIITLIFGFFGKPWVDAEINRRIKNEIDKVRDQTLASVQATTGYIFGELAKFHPGLHVIAANYSREAYNALDDEHPHKISAINNFVFFSSQVGKTDVALDCVRFAQELRVAYGRGMMPDFATTYAAAVIVYSDYFPDSRGAIDDAMKLMQELIDSEHTSRKIVDQASDRLVKLRGL